MKGLFIYASKGFTLRCRIKILQRPSLSNLLVLIYCLALFTLLPLPSHAVSFHVPEKLIYDLTWTGIKAGTASLEIKDDGNNVRIISTAQSAKWVSVFYTVDDRIESTLIKNEKFMSQRNTKDKENYPSPIPLPQGEGARGRVKEVFSGENNHSEFIGKPLNYRIKIREGRHRRNKEVIFDLNNKKATYLDYIQNERKEFDIPAFVFDPISSFYHIRTVQLDIGKPVYVTIFDSKKVWNVEVQVLRKEKVNLPIGTFDTIVIKPLMKSEGVFYRKGEILIWLTDDNKRIPVKLETKVVIGSVVATLVGGSY